MQLTAREREETARLPHVPFATPDAQESAHRFSGLTHRRRVQLDKEPRDLDMSLSRRKMERSSPVLVLDHNICVMFDKELYEILWQRNVSIG
jgi:hypothetical protein